MGVNACVTLSPKTTWEYVATVSNILLGAKAAKSYFSNDPKGGWSVRLADESKAYEPTSMPEYIYILVNGDPDNPVCKAIAGTDGAPYQMWYGLENRFLYPKATAAKIALAVGIAKFFGGAVTLNDATDAKRTFKAPAYIGAESGKPWYQLHQALLDLKPLTQKDIDRVAKHAAY